METLLKPTVLSFLKNDGWPVVETKENQIFQTQFKGNNGQWNCYLHIFEDRKQLVFYTLGENHIPPAHLQTVHEFITRVNSGMIIGNFELNLDHGGYRFKTSLDVSGDQLSEALVKQMVYANIVTMNKYVLGIDAIVTMNSSAIEAIKNIE